MAQTWPMNFPGMKIPGRRTPGQKPSKRGAGTGSLRSMAKGGTMTRRAGKRST
jgi:hypothetical protein